MRRRRRDEATVLGVLLVVLGLVAAVSLADHGERHGPPAFIGQYGFPPGKPDDRPPGGPPEDPPGKPEDRPPPHSGGPPHGGNPPGHQEPKGGGTPPGQDFDQASLPIAGYPMTPWLLLITVVVVAAFAFRGGSGLWRKVAHSRRGRRF